VAAARALGAGQESVAGRLADFDPPVANPGRATLLRIGDVSVFVDYAHNPAALAATLRTLHGLWGVERCVAAVTLPGDRRDDLLAACAQIVADGVGRAVLYDDEDPRGREPGEVSALVEREMRARRPKLLALRADGYREAITEALRLAGPGDVVLVLYEKLAPVLALLAEFGAVGGTGTPVAALPRAPGAMPPPARDLAQGVLLG
jgi:cyanophycin synthetase